MYAPPPPPPARRIPWLPIILLISVGILSVVGLCAFGGFQAMKMVNNDPPAREGFGKAKVVKYLSSGWAKYHIPELPLTLDLPGEPKPDTLEFETGSQFFTKNWVYYTLDTEHSTIEIVGQWYTSDDLYSQQEEIDAVADWVEYKYDGTNAKSESRPATFGKISGTEVWGSMKDGEDRINHRVFFWKHGKEGVISLIVTYYEEYQKESDADFRRIAASLVSK